MPFVKEIRPINGQLYYCNIDYSKNKHGDIIDITKRICAPLNNNTKSEIKDDKIVNVDDEKLENEITDINELNKDENMVTADAYEIRRQVVEDLENKQRTDRLEKELIETKSQINGIGEVIDKTIESRTGELNSKLVSTAV